MGTIVALEGISPFYNQVVEFQPMNPDEVILDLAESRERSEDGLTYTFKIRQGGTWQDGDLIVAGDVVFSIYRTIEEGEPRTRAGMLRTSTENAEPVDEYTAQVNLKLGVAWFLRLLAVDFMRVLPQRVLNRALTSTSTIV